TLRHLRMEMPFVIDHAPLAEFVCSGIQGARQVLNHQGNALMFQPSPEAKSLLTK
ncbi:hypothetical protein NDU88_004594, partial [Pleurodeles waltl]